MSETEVYDDEEAPDRVFNWRFESLLDAGAPPEVAEELAASRVDLHRACRALRAGCEPQLALYLLT